MRHALLCALTLPTSHPLWHALGQVCTVHRVVDPAYLERLAGAGMAQAALAGPDLDGTAATHLAARLDEAGLPLILVVPPGCTDPPVPTAAPIYGYLPADATAPQVAGTVAAAVQLHQHLAHLRTRLRRLEGQWEDRKLVEQAKGVLMARRGLSEPEAHRLLQQASMRRRLRMADLARSILSGPPDAPLAL